MWILTRSNQCLALAQDYMAHENGTGSAFGGLGPPIVSAYWLDNIDR